MNTFCHPRGGAYCSWKDGFCDDRQRAQEKDILTQKVGLAMQGPIIQETMLEVAVEALKYYADYDRYCEACRLDGRDNVWDEGGDRARAALHEIARLEREAKGEEK